MISPAMSLVAKWRTTDWVPGAGIDDENIIENRQDAFNAAPHRTRLVLGGGQRKRAYRALE
jgi:hypothetical protein